MKSDITLSREREETLRVRVKRQLDEQLIKLARVEIAHRWLDLIWRWVALLVWLKWMT